MSTVYQWIITLQIGSRGQVTASGTYSVVDPTTRTAIYNWVLNGVYEQIGTEEATVVFFSLEPDAIPAGAR